MPRSTTASTSTTDSPPPQSPLTPPSCELQLRPYLATKDVQMFDVDSRMREFSPSSLSSPPTSGKVSVSLAPISRNDSLSPNLLSHCPASTLPAPPSGHDLMQLFPPRSPQVGGLDRNARHGISTSSCNPVGFGVPAYANTSSYFGKEEREFFRLAGERVSGRELEIRLEKERGNRHNVNIEEEGRNRNVMSASHVQSQILFEPPTKRRKSVDVGEDTDMRETTSSPPPALTLGKLHQRSIPSQQHTSPQWQTTNTTTSFQILQQPTPTASQIQPPTNPGTRRRAGKYTKRVFVHPNPLPNVNPPYLLANVHPPGPNNMNPTINVYPLANPRPQKIAVPYPPNSPSHSSSFPQPTSQFVQFAR